MNARILLTKIQQRVLPNLRHLSGTRLGRCRVCLERSVIVSLSAGEEYKFCIRCRANLRYAMLADTLRALFPDLSRMTVVEFDPRSPLSGMLGAAGSYIRTYYSPTGRRGETRADGARCEDITDLTFEDGSIDLIVSSDVLEHVPDLDAALAETRRVLRVGGAHLLTVPPRARTRRRASLVDGAVHHILEPEYHSDPLNPDGILAFWDFGPDAGEALSLPGLDATVVAGPEGRDRRTVWKLERKDA